MKYLMVIEPTETGFSAYSPDLPGCVSTGTTREEVEQNMQEAMNYTSRDCVRKATPFPSRAPPLLMST
jgi:predicted RNase H-like HicB family nuclease